MVETVKRQHFVPQSYINRFREAGNLSVFFKESGQIRLNQTPKKYAFDRYYYDTSKDELKELMREQVALIPEMKQLIDWDDPQFLEHYFGRIEGDTKELFDRIEQNPAEIYVDGNVARIIIFLHDLAYRNHAYRDDIEKINAQTLKALSIMALSKSEKAYAEKMYGTKQAREQQLHAIAGVVPVLQTYQKLLGEYDLFFAIAEGNARFLISDDPAFAVRFDLPEICFPLSGKHALLFRKPNVTAPIMGTDVPVDNKISVSIPNVVRYNLFQFSFASRNVFGDALNLRQMKLLLEKAQVMNVGRSQSDSK